MPTGNDSKVLIPSFPRLSPVFGLSPAIPRETRGPHSLIQYVCVLCVYVCVRFDTSIPLYVRVSERERALPPPSSLVVASPSCKYGCLPIQAIRNPPSAISAFITVLITARPTQCTERIKGEKGGLTRGERRSKGAIESIRITGKQFSGLIRIRPVHNVSPI